MPQFYKTISSQQVSPGTGQRVEINGKDLALFNINGTFRAIDNTCPHQGGGLSDGALHGDLIACPWHGWRFNLTNGKCTLAPGAEVSIYATKIENGVVFVEM